MCSIKELTGRPRQAGQVESDLGVREGQGPGGGGGGGEVLPYIDYIGMCCYTG